MLVKRAKVISIEAIVRGYLTGFFPPYLHIPTPHEYLTGSGWAEYQRSGTVHGIPMPEGLVESQKLPAPLFTPSTKADQGQHDENISPQQGIRGTLTRKLRLSAHMTQLHPFSGRRYTTRSPLPPSRSTNQQLHML